VIDDVAGFESYTFLGPNFQVFPLVGLVCEPKFGPEASGVKSLKVKTKLVLKSLTCLIICVKLELIYIILYPYTETEGRGDRLGPWSPPIS
jgi:hypothetical protein